MLEQVKQYGQMKPIIKNKRTGHILDGVELEACLFYFNILPVYTIIDIPEDEEQQYKYNLNINFLTSNRKA